MANITDESLHDIATRIRREARGLILELADGVLRLLAEKRATLNRTTVRAITELECPACADRRRRGAEYVRQHRERKHAVQENRT